MTEIMYSLRTSNVSGLFGSVGMFSTDHDKMRSGYIMQ